MGVMISRTFQRQVRDLVISCTRDRARLFVYGTSLEKVTQMIMAFTARCEFEWDATRKKVRLVPLQAKQINWRDILFIAAQPFYVNYTVQEILANHFAVSTKITELFKKIDLDGVMKGTSYLNLRRTTEVVSVLAWLEFAKAVIPSLDKCYPTPTDPDDDYLNATNELVRLMLRGCYKYDSGAHDVHDLSYLGFTGNDDVEKTNVANTNEKTSTAKAKKDNQTVISPHVASPEDEEAYDEDENEHKHGVRDNRYVDDEHEDVDEERIIKEVEGDLQRRIGYVQEQEEEEEEEEEQSHDEHASGEGIDDYGEPKEHTDTENAHPTELWKLLNAERQKNVGEIDSDSDSDNDNRNDSRNKKNETNFSVSDARKGGRHVPVPSRKVYGGHFRA